MRKIVFLFLSALLIATTAYAGGSILGGRKNKSVNTDGVYAIGVHVCSSLECPPVRIIEGTCGGPHMTKHWGVCVCDKGYVFKNGSCETCPEGQYSDGMHACESCPKKTYRAHDDDTECTPCPDEYAATCADGTGESTTCEDNTYWEDDSCHPCPEEGVKSCSGTTLTCLDGYYKEDYDCLVCMLPFDTICSGEPAKDVNNCPTEKLEPCEGATPICANDHKKCECPVNCTCDIYGNIIALDGYYKNTATTCTACPDSKATMCADGTGASTACVDGYEVQGDVCVEVPNIDVGVCENGNVYISYNEDPCAEDTPRMGDPGVECVKNSDCEKGKYCKILGDHTHCRAAVGVGTCAQLDDGKSIEYEGKQFLEGSDMSFWAAENWCRAHSMHLVSATDLGLKLKRCDTFPPSSSSTSTCEDMNGNIVDMAFWDALFTIFTKPTPPTYQFYWTRDVFTVDEGDLCNIPPTIIYNPGTPGISQSNGHDNRVPLCVE